MILHIVYRLFWWRDSGNRQTTHAKVTVTTAIVTGIDFRQMEFSLFRRLRPWRRSPSAHFRSRTSRTDVRTCAQSLIAAGEPEKSVAILPPGLARAVDVHQIIHVRTVLGRSSLQEGAAPCLGRAEFFLVKMRLSRHAVTYVTGGLWLFLPRVRTARNWSLKGPERWMS